MNDKMWKKLDILSRQIGNTPLLDMGDGIYGKLEGNNPAGSIKDRAAFYMIMRALESGALKDGGTIVEATSGNTGIGLAYVAKELGLKTIIVMPESMSEQRRRIIADYGAELVLTKKEDGMAGAVAEASRIVSVSGAWQANQFGNFASIEAHYYTTAPELFMQAKDTKYVVAGVGSGGTAMGFARYIADNHIDCKVIAVEPASSPLMSKGIANAHKIQGIGANFVPELVDVSAFDGIMTVSDDDAFQNTRFIYQKYGVKCGISSGAAYCAALQLHKDVSGDIAVILPDNGDRYANSLYF